MIAWDVFKFSNEDLYKNHIIFYQKRTGLTNVIQMGTRKLNGTPIVLGVMDFQFMRGSMGFEVGEKITRLVKYATKKSMPLFHYVFLWRSTHVGKNFEFNANG